METYLAYLDQGYKMYSNKPESHRVWTKERTFRLIEEIRKRPLIWKPKTYSEKNFKERMAEAEEVRQAIEAHDVATLDIFDKWQGLRSTYRSELRKCVADTSYHPKWRFFEAMNFIRDTFRERFSRGPTYEDVGIEAEQEREEESQAFIHCGTRASSCPPEVDREEKKIPVKEIL
ncbi:hypothetical protein QR680_010621 [Steinernema hermaphroditum]|uniref:MADF domain-containing protein n=1 Tax=Steinernema hermaphroditum TaxID=289476 RepID=A0AA39IPL1_9BILA|nr:hypothetical protein QR680_010621 [Steinernema hermaphroditum]